MVKLNFRTNFGFRFELEVSSDDTLENIKHNIRRNHVFPVSSQTLSFNGVIIASDTHLLAARHRLIHGSEIRLDIAGEAERPLPATADYTTAASDAPKRVSSSTTLKLPEPFDAVNYEATDDSTLPKLLNAMMPHIRDKSPISSQARSFNDNIIGSATRLRAAAITDSLADEAPTVVTSNNRRQTWSPNPVGRRSAPVPKLISVSIPLLLPQPPPNRGPDAFTIQLVYINWKKEMVVNAERKASQLRLEALASLDIKIPDQFKFLHKNITVKETKTFKSQKIGHGAVIEIDGPMELVFKFLEVLGEPPVAPEILAQASAVPADDVKLRLIVKHGDATTIEDVWAGQDVDRLRVKLGKKATIPLPKTYLFRHKGKLLFENLSFGYQNVTNGDEIEIVPR